MIRYRVIDNGDGTSNVASDYGRLTGVQNEDIYLLYGEGNVIELPVLPLSRSPSRWRRMLRGAALSGKGET